MAAPRYETAYELGQRIGHTDSVVCTDCGAFVMDVAAHTRFHSILSGHDQPPPGDTRRPSP
jgi:predicted Rossmann-fold nucleotide-binding protein